MRKSPRQFHGWRAGGLTLFSSYWYPKGRTFSVASYHHPKRMCWLWFLQFEFHSRIMLSIQRSPGSQAKTYINFPFVAFLFCWQDQGRYTNASDERVRKLAGVKKWPTSL